MNEMQVFQNSEFGELGVLELEGKPWFPANRCAKVLCLLYTSHKAPVFGARACFFSPCRRCTGFPCFITKKKTFQAGEKPPSARPA